eukprot:jgi/Tetstr1/449280/TSEL_036483.t1
MISSSAMLMGQLRRSGARGVAGGHLLQAAIACHLSDADARVMERDEAEAASCSQKELTAFPDKANNSRLQNELREIAAVYFFLPK